MTAGGPETTGADAPREAVDRLERELEEICADWLRPHIERIRSGAVQPRPKVINDGLWGSLRLFPWEVAVLDSYLLQRLRFIRQLGVAHWVYPTAGHSRFEHSLGALHQMTALIDGLERNSGRAGDRAVADVDAKLLRLAALVHDCGHCLLSHVPETVIDKLPGVEDLRSRMWKRYKSKKRPSTSESFAAVFVRSSAFQELLGLPQVGADFLRDVGVATTRIASLIVGGPALPKRAFLSLLLSGPFDADKLDYMPRDCMMAGVPCAVDVRRIIEKVHALDVSVALLREQGLEELANWAGAGTDERVRIISISAPGARALKELAMTRGILFEKVYYHHKVRALEAMARRALEPMAASAVRDWLELVDDDVLRATTLPRFKALRERQLLKRALTVSVTQSYEAKEMAAWRKLTGSVARFRDLIHDQALRIATSLAVGEQSLKEQKVEVDLPDVKKMGLDTHAFVGDSVEEFAQATPALAGQRSEAGTRAALQQLYVFAPEDAVLPTFIATKNVLKIEYGLSVEPAAYRATRLDPELILEAEKKLIDGDFYRGQPKPEAVSETRVVSHREGALEAFLRTAWPRIEELGVTFGRYQTESGEPVSPARIASFLRQFRTEARARAALRMLESIEFKNRDFFVEALESRLSAAREGGFDVHAVCPLGGTGDSSALLGYLMNDVEVDLRRPVAQLELALENHDGDLLLWDDFCGAAGHAVTTLCQWLGITDERRMLDEHLADPLSPERLESFNQRRVIVGFAAARASGIANLRSFLSERRIENVEVLEPHEEVAETGELFPSASIISDTAAREDLRAFLAYAADKAFEPRRRREHRPWDAKKCSERLLGYGNGGHLLVFFYNVPSITLTPLWVKGENQGDWMPLFPRREKPDLATATSRALPGAGESGDSPGA